MHTNRFNTISKIWMQFHVCVIPCLPIFLHSSIILSIPTNIFSLVGIKMLSLHETIIYPLNNDEFCVGTVFNAHLVG